MLNFRNFKPRQNFNNVSQASISFRPIISVLKTAFSKIGSKLGKALDLSPSKAFAAMFIAFILLGAFYWFRVVSTGIGGSTSTASDQRSQLPPPQASQKIDQEFSFPLRDQNGKEVSKLKVVLQNAELRDQIIVKAQRVTAISGRTFLILNLKITNEFNKTIQVNTRDYFRLSVNKNDKELLAPEIHNDPVEAQASSIKYTKLAFAINDSDKDLKLKVGELDKEKTDIDLKF